MRVLLLSDFFHSGQTTHVLDLSKQLKKLGTEVHIMFGTIHSNLFWSYYAPQLSAQNISFSHGRDLTSLTKKVSKWKPDLIHCQSSTLFSTTQYLALRQNLPFVLTCHGLGFQHPRYRLPLKLASAIIAIGPNVALELLNYKDKVTIILNGVDLERFKPSPSKRTPKKVLYVGRLEQKRIPPLQSLAKAHFNLTKRPLEIIADWNPQLPRTKFIPWQVDLVTHLQKSCIVAACGRTAREALSCGNAVLLMQQNYDGVISPQLVSATDFDFSGNLGRFSLHDLEKDLRKLLHSVYQLKKLQRWGRKYAEKSFSSLEMAEETLKLYKKVVDSPYFAPSSKLPF